MASCFDAPLPPPIAVKPLKTEFPPFVPKPPVPAAAPLPPAPITTLYVPVFTTKLEEYITPPPPPPPPISLPPPPPPATIKASTVPVEGILNNPVDVKVCMAYPFE